MDIEAFKASVGNDTPPEGLSPALASLWHQGKGEWDTAHGLVQPESDEDSAWVHAHLHRVEGDERNAGHWYRRAGRPHSTLPLAEEWREIASSLL